MKYRLIIATFCILSIYSCNKIKYYPDKDYQEVKTRVLAHKAGGGDFSPYQEYSPEAAKYSLPIMDGIEVDLQISKNRTIWMSHNADLSDCGGVHYDCFAEVTDNQINVLDSCNGNTTNYFRLEDIFSLLSSEYPEKYISLDVKAWTPCEATSLDIIGEMNVIADEIIQLNNKYKLSGHIMVESETATFLDYVKKHSSGIETYLTSLGDFERAMQLTLESGYTGISFKYKFKEEIGQKEVQLIRRKGLKIQLWTVDSDNDIKEALSINPDFIQTDNITFFEDTVKTSKYFRSAE
jgi:glycerophosphoryl diester phosphodiesterase